MNLNYYILNFKHKTKIPLICLLLVLILIETNMQARSSDIATANLLLEAENSHLAMLNNNLKTKIAHYTSAQTNLRDLEKDSTDEVGMYISELVKVYTMKELNIVVSHEKNTDEIQVTKLTSYFIAENTSDIIMFIDDLINFIPKYAILTEVSIKKVGESYTTYLSIDLYKRSVQENLLL